MDPRGEMITTSSYSKTLYQQKNVQHIREELTMLCHHFNKAQVMKYSEQVYKAHVNTSACSLVSAPT